MLALPLCSCPKSQGTRATGQVGLGQGNPTGRGLSAAVTPATTLFFFSTPLNNVHNNNVSSNINNNSRGRNTNVDKN